MDELDFEAIRLSKADFKTLKEAHIPGWECSEPPERLVHYRLLQKHIISHPDHFGGTCVDRLWYTISSDGIAYLKWHKKARPARFLRGVREWLPLVISVAAFIRSCLP